MAGAVLHAPFAALHAQVRDTTKKRDTTIAIPTPPRGDSLLRDSLARLDSIHQARLRADTIKSPLAHAELPTELAIGHRFFWNRDSLFATGAITLADLLERVPGLTLLHAGWISAPAVAGYMGDLRRVRVFYDGFEQVALDPRGRGVPDLTQMNLWSVEDALIEETADEIRVHLRSWRVRNTIPETRTDVSTGDQQTNLYRGFFGKRFHGGAVLQFGAQQYGTTPPSLLGTSSDQTGIIVRAGWAKQDWSFDGYATRISRHRGTILGSTLEFAPADSIPNLESSRNDAYLRAAYGDPDISRLWAQVMLVGSKYDYTGIRNAPLPVPNPMTHGDSVQDSIARNRSLDTNTYRSQYILTAGTVLGPLRLSASGRLFAGGGRTIPSPAVRASYTVGRLGLSAYFEGKGIDSVSHTDVTAQLTPLSFISVLGSVGRVSDDHRPDSTVTRGYSAKYARGEVGLRLRGLWVVGGLILRDSARLQSPRAYDTIFVPVTDKSATGATLALRGRLWRFLQADVSAIRWNDSAGFYRPRYQTRSELFVRTNLLERFPSNDFGLMASIVHEYRSNVHFPTSSGDAVAPAYRTFSTLLEIRILSATISWQFRNFLGERYMQVPNFIMPRQTNFYGVRWYFTD